MNRGKSVAAVLLIVLMLSGTVGCGNARKEAQETAYSKEAPLVFRLASDAPRDHMATGLNNDLCAMIARETDGRVLVDYYPAAQLGGYETVYSEVVNGRIDMAQISVPDSEDSRLAIAYLPYYATNFSEAEILYAPDSYMSRIFAGLTAESGVRFMGWVLEGFIGFGCVKEPENATEPGAPKNIRLRVPEMLTTAYVVEDLGFEPVTVSYTQVPKAMRDGAIDGWSGGTPNMNYSWLRDQITVMYINYIHAETTSYVMSEESFQKLTPEDREIVVGAFEKQSRKSFLQAEENEDQYKQKLAENGIRIIELTPEEVAANAAFVREVTWTRLEETLTPELIAGFRDEIESLEEKEIENSTETE